MIREKIKHTDFFRIAKNNEYFIWHFVQKDQHLSGLNVSSIIDFEKEKNDLRDILENLDIPYYESYTEDSIDFLMGLGFKYEQLFNSKLVLPKPPKEFRYTPLLIVFKKFTKVYSTLDICYCLEGIIECISKLDSKYLKQILDNIEKNPD